MESYQNVNTADDDFDRADEDDDQVQLDSVDDLATQTAGQLSSYVYIPYEYFLVRYVLRCLISWYRLIQ